MKEHEILFSIIIPTYKRNDRLLTCISSCYHDIGNVNVEVIIVDDNGRGTIEQVKNFNKITKLNYSENFKYIINDYNVGGAISRNNGAKYSCGTYLIFMDDDDLFISSALKEKKIFIDKYNPEAFVTDMRVFDEAKNKFIDTSYSKFKGGDLKSQLIDGNFFTPMLTINKNLFNKVNGFPDVKKFQDHLLLIKLYEHIDSILHLPKQHFIHTVHSDERITNKNFKIGWEDRVNIESKYLYILNKSELNKIKFKWNYNIGLSFSLDFVNILFFLKYFTYCLLLIRNRTQFNRTIILLMRYFLGRDFLSGKL